MAKLFLVLVALIITSSCTKSHNIVPKDSRAMHYLSANRESLHVVSANQELKNRWQENHSAKNHIPAVDEVTPEEKMIQDSLLALSIIRVLITPLPLAGF